MFNSGRTRRSKGESDPTGSGAAGFCAVVYCESKSMVCTWVRGDSKLFHNMLPPRRYSRDYQSAGENRYCMNWINFVRLTYRRYSAYCHENDNIFCGKSTSGSGHHLFNELFIPLSVQFVSKLTRQIQTTVWFFLQARACSQTCGGQRTHFFRGKQIATVKFSHGKNMFFSSHVCSGLRTTVL